MHQLHALHPRLSHRRQKAPLASAVGGQEEDYAEVPGETGGGGVYLGHCSPAGVLPGVSPAGFMSGNNTIIDIGKPHDL